MVHKCKLSWISINLRPVHPFQSYTRVFIRKRCCCYVRNWRNLSQTYLASLTVIQFGWQFIYYYFSDLYRKAHTKKLWTLMWLTLKRTHKAGNVNKNCFTYVQKYKMRYFNHWAVRIKENVILCFQNLKQMLLLFGAINACCWLGTYFKNINRKCPSTLT